ncbi:ABC transporter [Moraxella nonliquefaciens]|jgi:ABC transporter related|uniref:ABC transporter n=2 Tax=Moraxella nonliquefaciens TaxID=478 RepID=A0A1B8QM40_MORNO|nr:ABC transporter ATP-binding protein [Moraxella nonliquefaciens]MCG7411558.1 ABC transporter ATP-binding protein [Moraxella nonliquefaciens]MDI4498537.1 ABC transporter ATP-binding protein [Moraxella nonliquefaciens]MDI4500311.1 ABC transporter ATP-binding protein [Moraxella nonliquefaciens]OBX51891.1 ABC transporter [Moraxella nonliquefaciens]OBX84920.1 ABC transporter [Moraxella nonliquefaciens]
MTMPALTISNLKKTYPNGFTALKGVDLTVPQGEFFALLGANGAGKSTMIGIISSLFPQTDGTVQIFGVDLHKNPSLAKSYLGIVPQEFNFNQFEKCLDILIIQAGYYGIKKKDALPRAQFLLKELGLWDKQDEKARSLSGGMKRRLMIARALIHRPKLLILDEPTAGVDIELRRSMWDFIEHLNKNEGTTIILTTHYLEEAEQLCKYIAILNHGEILINTDMKSLLTQLSLETFVFDLKDELNNTPTINNISHITLSDNKTLEITLNKNQNLNDVFRQLNDFNIQIVSMRNKNNRLEELFMGVVDNHSQNSK